MGKKTNKLSVTEPSISANHNCSTLSTDNPQKWYRILSIFYYDMIDQDDSEVIAEWDVSNPDETIIKYSDKTEKTTFSLKLYHKTGTICIQGNKNSTFIWKDTHYPKIMEMIDRKDLEEISENQVIDYENLGSVVDNGVIESEDLGAESNVSVEMIDNQLVADSQKADIKVPVNKSKPNIIYHATPKTTRKPFRKISSESKTKENVVDQKMEGQSSVLVNMEKAILSYIEENDKRIEQITKEFNTLNKRNLEISTEASQQKTELIKLNKKIESLCKTNEKQVEELILQKSVILEQQEEINLLKQKLNKQESNFSSQIDRCRKETSEYFKKDLEKELGDKEELDSIIRSMNKKIEEKISKSELNPKVMAFSEMQHPSDNQNELSIRTPSEKNKNIPSNERNTQTSPKENVFQKKIYGECIMLMDSNSKFININNF